MTRIAVIGGGLSGLLAAYFAAQRGAEVALVAFGQGGLSLSHGGIELWGSATPSRSIARLSPPHPYALAGDPALRAGLDVLRELMKQAGISLHGSISSHHHLLSAAGLTRQVTLYPPGAAVIDQMKGSPIAIAALPGLRDYYPELIAYNMRNSGLMLSTIIELPLIDLPTARTVYALDLARHFENPSWRKEAIRAWKPKLTGVNRLILPACLGIQNSAKIRNELETELGVSTYELALLPPTVPGLRQQVVLHRALENLGVRRIEGARAIGRFDGASGGRRTAGVVLETAGAMRILDANAVILATGGVLHGGLEGLQNDAYREPVFQIPLQHKASRDERVSASPFQQQPYALAGVLVNSLMQPLGADRKPFLDNLYAVGGLIASADRTNEGSRQGIDIATAYKAVESALTSTGRPGIKPARKKEK